MCVLPVEKILALFVLVRSGDLIDRRAEAIGLLGEILSALSLCMGGSDPIVSNSVMPDTLEACMDQADILMSEPTTQAINPALLALLLKIAELLIKKYL